MKKRKGFAALVEFMGCLAILSLTAGVLPITLAVNEENYANQLIASLQMLSSKTRLNPNVLAADGIGDVVSAAATQAGKDYPGMTLQCITTNVNSTIQSCTITYKILWITKTKSITFTQTYINGGKLLG